MREDANVTVSSLRLRGAAKWAELVLDMAKEA
jgi:hypothetical protein